MRRLRFVPLVFSLLAIPCRAEPPVVAKLQAGRETVRIVAFGDSITGVYYHTGGRRAWCDMLGIALGRIYPQAKLEMINAGISGNTSAVGLGRIERDVLARRPDLVVVMFGMNDAARAPREQFAGNLQSIVERCRKAGAAVVLSTPNDVYANPARPIDRLAEFAQTVRDVARRLDVPLADCYAAYEEVLGRDPLRWKLLMSETIHPSMNGHKLFAEVMAGAISGRRVSLADAGAPPDTLRFTLARLRAGEPVSMIAMPPYDRIVPEALRKRFPAARIEVTLWPVEGRTLSDLEQWARGVRKQPPHLVVVAVPAGAGAGGDEAMIRSYSWVLNSSIDFGLSKWDRVAVLPSVTGPLSPEEKRRAEIARQVIAGGDCECLDRLAGDRRGPEEIVGDWVRRQIEIVRK